MKQLRFVGSACVFAQRAAERQVLRLGLRRESGRISRQKREWRLIIPPVLGKIEMHAADEMPRGFSLKKRLDRRLRFGELGSKRCGGLSPECFENRSRRYSAPVIGGAAAASASSSLSAGARMSPWSAVRSGCVQMAVTNRALKSRQ